MNKFKTTRGIGEKVNEDQLVKIFEYMYRYIVGDKRLSISMKILDSDSSSSSSSKQQNIDSVVFFDTSSSIELCLLLSVSLFCQKCNSGVTSLEGILHALFRDFCGGSIFQENLDSNVTSNDSFGKESDTKIVQKIYISMNEDEKEIRFILDRFIVDFFFDISGYENQYSSISINPSKNVLPYLISGLTHCRQERDVDNSSDLYYIVKDVHGLNKNSKKNLDYFKAIDIMESEIDKLSDIFSRPNLSNCGVSKREGKLKSSKSHLIIPNNNFISLRVRMNRYLHPKNLMKSIEKRVREMIIDGNPLALCRTIWTATNIVLMSKTSDWFTFVTHTFGQVCHKKDFEKLDGTTIISSSNHQDLTPRNKKTTLLLFSALLRICSGNSNSLSRLSRSIFSIFYASYICDSSNFSRCVRGQCDHDETINKRLVKIQNNGKILKNDVMVDDDRNIHLKMIIGDSVLLARVCCISIKSFRTGIRSSFMRSKNNVYLSEKFSLRAPSKSTETPKTTASSSRYLSKYIDDVTNEFESSISNKNKDDVNFCCSKSLPFILEFSKHINKTLQQKDMMKCFRLTDKKIDKIHDIITKRYVRIESLFNIIIPNCVLTFDHDNHINIERRFIKMSQKLEGLKKYVYAYGLDFEYGDHGKFYVNTKTDFRFYRTSNFLILSSICDKNGKGIISLSSGTKKESSSSKKTGDIGINNVLQYHFERFVKDKKTYDINSSDCFSNKSVVNEFHRSNQLFKGPIIISNKARNSVEYNPNLSKLANRQVMSFYARTSKDLSSKFRGDTYVFITGPYYKFKIDSVDPKRRTHYSSDILSTFRSRYERIKSFKVFSYVNHNILKRHDIKENVSHPIYEYVRSPLPLWCVCNRREVEEKREGDRFCRECSILESCSGFDTFRHFPLFCSDGGYPYWTIQTSHIVYTQDKTDIFPHHSTIPFKMNWNYSRRFLSTSTDTMSEYSLFNDYLKSSNHSHTAILDRSYLAHLHEKSNYRLTYRIINHLKSKKISSVNRKHILCKSIDKTKTEDINKMYSANINDVDREIFENNPKSRDITTAIIFKSLFGFSQSIVSEFVGEDEIIYFSPIDDRARSTMFGNLVPPKIPIFNNKLDKLFIRDGGRDIDIPKTYTRKNRNCMNNNKYREIFIGDDRDSIDMIDIYSKNLELNSNLTIDSDNFMNEGNYSLDFAYNVIERSEIKESTIDNLCELANLTKGESNKHLPVVNHRNRVNIIIDRLRKIIYPVVKKFVDKMDSVLREFIGWMFGDRMKKEYVCLNVDCSNYGKGLIEILNDTISVKSFWSFNSQRSTKFEKSPTTKRLYDYLCNSDKCCPRNLLHMPSILNTVKDIRLRAFSDHSFFDIYMNLCRFHYINVCSENNFKFCREYEDKINQFNNPKSSPSSPKNRSDFDPKIPLDKNYSKEGLEFIKDPNIMDRYVSSVVYDLRDTIFVKINGINIKQFQFLSRKTGNKSKIIKINESHRNKIMESSKKKKTRSQIDKVLSEIEQRKMIYSGPALDYSTATLMNSSICSEDIDLDNRAYDLFMGNRRSIYTHILGFPQQGFGISLKCALDYNFKKNFRTSIHRETFTYQYVSMLYLTELKESIETIMMMDEKFGYYSSSGKSKFRKVKPSSSKNVPDHCFYYDLIDESDGVKKLEFSRPWEFLFSIGSDDTDDSDDDNKSSKFEPLKFTKNSGNNLVTHKSKINLHVFNSYELLGWLTYKKNLRFISRYLDRLNRAVKIERDRIANRKKDHDNYTFGEFVPEVNRVTPVSNTWLSEIYLPLVLQSIRQTKKVIGLAESNENWEQFLYWTQTTFYPHQYLSKISEDIIYAISNFLQQC